MVGSLNSITLNIEDEGSFETLVLHGLIVDVVATAFRTAWVDFYVGYDLEEDTKVKLHRRKVIINACKEWETYVKQLPPDRGSYEKSCGRYQAFRRALIADRDMHWKDPSPPDSDLAGRFEAWMGRRGDKVGDEHEEYIRPFNIQQSPVACIDLLSSQGRDIRGLGAVIPAHFRTMSACSEAGRYSLF